MFFFRVKLHTWFVAGVPNPWGGFSVGIGTTDLQIQTVGNLIFYQNTDLLSYLWPPYVIGMPLYFCGVFFLLSSFFFSLPNLSGHRLDVYHTLTHGVALVRI